MSFDQKTRNLLQRTVSACRKILDEEFAAQRRGTYGINDDGTAAPLDTLAHLADEDMQVAKLLRDRLDHLAAGLTAQGKKEAEARKEAIGRITREQAFTVLNRLAALRMAEEREIVLECVRHGLQSEGFLLFQQSAGSAFGETWLAYRAYILVIFDELAIDLGVLFSRWDPAGLLFPGKDALEAVLKELGGTGTAMAREEISPEAFNAIWSEDETIGWIYQYYNDQAERKKMRDESAAPRNSRELAVRNQFFTPRYVVEFLTDNTLGRIWYEMCRGQTRLKEQCRYLVRRPNEIFLAEGECAPGVPSDQSSVISEESLTQEQLLKQPVHIPHRPLKDPRTILMLDPACGSMHFGLYAFDLFEVIYEEAWDLFASSTAHCSLITAHSLTPLTTLYASKQEFMRDVPRMIIEHNIHGIDIDPRCAQIAGLSLWLRAQKAWQRLGLKPAERPAIKRSNIVCAEPMPGEKELLREFVEREFPAAERAVCLRLLEAIFDKMQLAGEAGSLLKIEEEIRSAIEDARQAWSTLQSKPRELFSTDELNKASRQTELTGLEDASYSLITDHGSLTTDFWQRIEERIYAALRDYAEQAENGGGFQRRLFAEDAARGFAFIDVCRKRYDVALMNPPFGEPSLSSRKYLENEYSAHKTELLASFVSKGLFALSHQGLLGVLSSRTMLVNATCEELRLEIGKKHGGLRVFADLGYGVLDAAMVEAAAYVSERGANKADSSLFISLLKDEDKGRGLLLAINQIPAGNTDDRTRICFLAGFAGLFRFPWAYWLPPELLACFSRFEHLEKQFARVRVGSSTADNFRFLRLNWEVERTVLGASRADTFNSRYWVALAKGGEYWPLYDDIHLTINWAKGGVEIVESAGSTIRSPDDYFLGGCTYPYRTTSAFALRALPEGAIFSDGGPAIIPQSGKNQDRWTLLCYSNTRIARYFLEVFLGEGDAVVSGSAARNYIPRAVGAVPIPDLSNSPFPASSVRDWYQAAIMPWLEDETTRVFTSFARSFSGTITAIAKANQSACLKKFEAALEASWMCEQKIADLLGLTDAALKVIRESCGYHPCEHPSKGCDDLDVSQLYELQMDALVDSVATTLGGGRFITKKSFYADRRIELISHALHRNPRDIIKAINTHDLSEPGHCAELAARLISWTVGSTFGRWDIRYATGEQAAPELPDPFAPLPVCPPGQLQNAQGLPARPEDVPAAYPVRIPWDGILVDDPNHPLDIERRVREVIAIIWSGKEGGPSAEAIEHEACEILGVKSLRDYFRKPAGFFADHLKRYSKSRRQAPIYWPLSTASGSYTLWIYYHRLTNDTLYKCLQDFVEPKIAELEKDLHRYRTMVAADEAGTRERKQLADAETLLDELRALHADLSHWAPRWKPNLNDGVVITASPLWKLFRLPKWQKTLKETWQALENGEYDWAHLAHTLWSDRVREKCKRDRSLAIAHNLEELCEIKAPVTKKKAAKKAAKKKGKAKIENEEDEPELIKEEPTP